MKKSLIALAVMGAFSSAAMAQSNVTVYGLIDLSVNYTTNQDSHGNAVWSLGDSNAGTGAGDGGQGAMSGSRIGFKGEEDLGGGNKALFKMESGFTANNGVSDQQGQLFGRQVFAGLSNKDLGQLTFGRQYGIMTDVAFDFDPLGVGNYSANEWEVFLFGVRFDNTIWYKNQVGPVQVNVQYSMGGVAGSTSQGSTEGFSVKYNQGPLGLAGAYQQSTDANSNNLSVGSLDGTFNFGPATVFLDYYHIKTDAGFAKAGSHSGGPLGTTSMLIVNSAATDRKDQLWTLGLAYNFTPAVTLTVAYMDDQISQDVVGDGSMKSAYALLEYHLSKRTEVYATVDRSTASGQALTTAASGSGTLNGIGAGETASSAVAAGLRVTF
jgi:predicted porin